jgi:uncharacterized membrane protein
MEAFVETWALRGALLLDALATLAIVAGCLQAAVRAAAVFGKPHAAANLRPLRRRLSEWLALGLELLIGSDIVRTAVSPSWADLGQLGAIVVLRALIDFSLIRETSGFREAGPDVPPQSELS